MNSRFFGGIYVDTCQYMPLHELGDHIWEKAITSCIRIGAAMRSCQRHEF